MKTFWSTLFVITLLSFSASANDIDYAAMEKNGFADVASMLKSMTPEQRETIMKQARIKEQELQKLSPADLERLRRQLRKTADTIDIDKVDPDKLDPNKAKSAKHIQKDLDTYQKKYEKNQIRNSVVKPPVTTH